MKPPNPKLILASRSPRRRQLLAEAGYQFDVWPPDESAEDDPCSDETPEHLVARLARRKAESVVEYLQSGATGVSPVPNPPTPSADWDPRADPRPEEEGTPAPGATAGLSNSGGFPLPPVPLPQAGEARTVVVLGCDTVAECDGTILGKPRDAHHARTILRHLSGREHRVLSGLCLWPVSNRTGQPDKPTTNPKVRVAVTRLRMDQLDPDQLERYIAGGQWRGKAGAFGYQDGLDWVHVLDGSESNVVGLPMELLAEMLAEASTNESRTRYENTP